MTRHTRMEEWKGLWIWSGGETGYPHRNEYTYARKGFRLGSPVVSARVRVSADNRYVLFVNGQRVCRGPARCEPRYQSYDEVDLAPWLKVGENCIAVLAHHYGESTFQSVERGGCGFILDGEVRTRRERPVPLHTDESWKAVRAEAYNRETARYDVQLGFQEDFDAGVGPGDWTAVEFDGGAWPAARVYGAALAMPYERLEPRGTPLEREEPAGFVAVRGAFVGECGAGYRDANNAALLMAGEQRAPAREPIFRDIPACLGYGREPMVVVPPPAGRFSALVLDAGSETTGFLDLDVEGAGGEIIDFYYCEHIDEHGNPYIRAGNGDLIGMADRYRCRAGRQRHQFFSWKGFRYVLAVFRDVEKPLQVRRIGLTFTSYPVERRGLFECSDPMLNDIWRVGAWTQQLCMHDAYIDCPWREQAQWWGDARVQWRVNMAVFGDTALFRRGLRQAAQSQIHNGLTYGVFPSDAHWCVVPDYTLAWVCSLWDYYWYSGDDAPIREQFDAVVKALDWFEVHAGRDHLCGNPGAGLWLFLDWAPLDKRDRSATFTLQYLEALRVAARMAAHLGRPEARKYRLLAGQVERAAVRAFWDSKGRQFFEGFSREEGRPSRQVSQHANAYAILTGVQPRRHGDIADRITWIFKNHDELFAANAGGNQYVPDADFPIASPFFYAYVLDALIRAGRAETAVEVIRTLWGRIVMHGVTTWPETWNHGSKVCGSSSACHAWSAGPTYHLSELIGGVRPIEPGFARVRISPRMFDLEQAVVRYPTPRGEIGVEWQRMQDGGMKLKVRLPKRVMGELEAGGEKRRLAGGVHRVRTSRL